MRNLALGPLHKLFRVYLGLTSPPLFNSVLKLSDHFFQEALLDSPDCLRYPFSRFEVFMPTPHRALLVVLCICSFAYLSPPWDSEL